MHARTSYGIRGDGDRQMLQKAIQIEGSRNCQTTGNSSNSGQFGYKTIASREGLKRPVGCFHLRGHSAGEPKPKLFLFVLALVLVLDQPHSN